MGEVRFMISEAAKQVHVESHVLRYWEEELDLTIGRTEMGHRYYTEDDIQLFRCIKKLKNEGMLLRDLKPLIPELKATRRKLTSAKPEGKDKPAQIKADQEQFPADKPDAEQLAAEDGRRPDLPDIPHTSGLSETIPEKSSAPDAAAELSVSQAEVIPVTQLEQARNLIGDVLTEVVTSNNELLEKNISKKVTADVIREMDFLFQAKERREEEHFRKLDCLIRQQQANRREASRETPLGKLRKILT